jgi:hypothetical protein
LWSVVCFLFFVHLKHADHASHSHHSVRFQKYIGCAHSMFPPTFSLVVCNLALFGELVCCIAKIVPSPTFTMLLHIPSQYQSRSPPILVARPKMTNEDTVGNAMNETMKEFTHHLPLDITSYSCVSIMSSSSNNTRGLSQSRIFCHVTTRAVAVPRAVSVNSKVCPSKPDQPTPSQKH